MKETNNKGMKFDKMVKDKVNDELGLFEKYDEILSEMRSRIIKHKAKSVIDIGCGTGNLCGELSDKIEVIGVDSNLEMLEHAKSKYKNMNFKLGSFLDKPFRENDVDIVVTTYAFHGLNDNEKKESINNILEYLKDDGKIIIADFMFANDMEREKCINNLLSNGREDLLDVITHKYYTNVESLEKYIKTLNCKISSKHIVNYTWLVEIEK